jgi:hypothetical protein
MIPGNCVCLSELAVSENKRTALGFRYLSYHYMHHLFLADLSYKRLQSFNIREEYGDTLHEISSDDICP